MSRTPNFLQYNRDDVLNTVDKLNIYQDVENKVITEFAGRQIAKANMSDRYGVFNFKEFINNVISPVEHLFQPKRMNIMIDGGHQELRLLGDERIVNGQKYDYMLSIFSSSDGSRALTLACGLMRLVCSNGMVIGVPGEHANIRTKHFEKSMAEKVLWFISNLEKIPQTIEQQIALMNGLEGKNVSLKQIANNICFTTDDEGKIKELVSMKQAFKNFLNTLWYSNTDKLDKNLLTVEQKKLFWRPDSIINNKTSLDIMLPATQAFNCWTENVRDKDMSKIQLESTRIYNALNQAIDFEDEMQEF